MIEREPVVELQGFSSPGAAETPWAQGREQLADVQLYWLTTVRPDGRPHVTPLLGVWSEGGLYLCTGATDAKNLSQNANCILTTGRNDLEDGLDVVAEGEAARCRAFGRPTPEDLGSPPPGVGSSVGTLDVMSSRSERQAARELIAAYHEARLADLVQRVGEAIDRFRAGETDAFEADQVIFQYSRSAKELWKFCNAPDVEFTAQLIQEREQVDWWAQGAPTSK